MRRCHPDSLPGGIGQHLLTGVNRLLLIDVKMDCNARVGHLYLHLGQPALSGALARLRVMFNDPLFVRSSKSLVPTPRAESLVRELLPMMEHMQQILFQPAAFSPAQDTRQFRLGMS
ncbi:regulatory helix-turn-helix LysR family protein [Biostraticola tofi]|uniref:Regulatory helix-turn-helix LysR family protein n=2 Tax=Biostraticola tofi TaxID=466109 RepID=A0A4R3YZF7_9GAMM|nr:regulatory helix-turn-helix LysR family protein [Biostraticola tofi]